MAMVKAISGNIVHIAGYGVNYLGNGNWEVTGSEPVSDYGIPNFYDPGVAGFYGDSGPPDLEVAEPKPVIENVAKTPKPPKLPDPEPPAETKTENN